MKILVTGATGYIGAHLIKALAEEGHIVDGTDFNLRQNDVSRYVTKMIPWDIRMQHYGKLFDYDTVVHLAARTMVSLSVQQPREFYETNILGTMNVIDTLVDVGHFVYCSTGSAFNPATNPYAMSKKAAEDMVSKLPHYSICRFYNVSGNDGFQKFDNSYYHMIRRAAAVANGKFPEIPIYGTNYPTHDGTAIRNYSHIKDTVKSIVKIVKHGSTNSVECLGSTKGHSVLDVIYAMELVSGKQLPTVVKDPRPGDAAESVMPEQSKFYSEMETIFDQCLSALENEI